ncbi:MAG: phosphatase PAP2-related protein [Candidatus Woesearchaeota archaeon]
MNKSNIKKWYNEWRLELSKHKYLIVLSLLFFILAELIAFFASSYVDRIPTTSVQDLILDNIPVLKLDILFIYGFLVTLVIIAVYSFLFKVKEFHKIGILFSLLVLTRSVFLILTHLGIPADARVIWSDSGLSGFFYFRNDLFFSGHAAIPFMAFLIFRKELIGKLFLVLTAVLSLTVLFMHVHYSIDVFSAFFITYGVYHFGQWLIDKEYFNTK